MDLDEDFNFRADRLTHCLHPFDRQSLFGPTDVGPPRIGEWIELERRKATPDHFVGRTRKLMWRFRALRPAVCVDADAIAAGSAEEVVDRLTAGLADDVPERVLQRTQRRPEVHRRPAQSVIQVTD